LTDIIGYFLVAAVVIAITIIVRTSRKKEEKESLNKDRMNFTVHVPKIIRITSIVVASVFGTVLFLLLIPSPDEQSLLLNLLALAFMAGALYFLYYSFRWKLVVKEDELIFTPLFGKKRNYNVKDITNIKIKNTYSIQVFRNGNRLFSAPGLSQDGVMLVSYLIEKGVKTPAKINEISGNWY